MVAPQCLIIALLVVACILLWSLSKYGPGGADWVGNQTKALFGLETKAEPEPAKEPLGTTGSREPGAVPIPAQTLLPMPASGEDPRLARAKETIVDTLGGPDKVVVQHVAISTDEKSMVAAVRLVQADGSHRREEILF